jgi:uncharacterized membrane-anchored protein
MKLLRRPAAFIPVTMSLMALAIVLFHIAKSGHLHEADEGTAAHLFQLLMVCQLPLIAWFAVAWLPRELKAALQVLALQAAAGFSAFAALFYLEH